MMIGFHTKKIIDVKLLSKIYATFLSAEIIVEEVVDQYYPKIMRGSEEGQKKTQS